VISPGSFFLAYLPRRFLVGGCPCRQHGKAAGVGREYRWDPSTKRPNDELPSSRLEKPSHQHEAHDVFEPYSLDDLAHARQDLQRIGLRGACSSSLPIPGRSIT
jgi:hypothetical protein